MASGLRRSVLYTLLACALLALALLPPRPRREQWVFRPARTDMRAARQLEQASQTLQGLELRDSVLSLVRARQPFADDSLAFLFPSRFPERAERAVRALIGASWRARADGTPRVRLVLALRVDSAPRARDSVLIPRYTTVGKILPEVTDGHTCLSIVSVGRGYGRSIASNGTLGLDLIWQLRRAGVGACAYFGAFGVPGKGVGDWLAARKYAPLYDLNWTDDPLAVPPQRMSRSGMSWWEAGFVEFVGCAAGDQVRCRSVLWGQPNPNARGPQFADFDVPGVSRGGFRTDTYLADMVAHYGRERFERFWTSDAPIEQAFEVAMGEPIGKWTMQWARARIGDPEVGAPTRAVPAFLGVMVSLVVVGAAAALTRLRQVA